MLAIKIFFAVLIIICAVFYVMYLWDFAFVLLIVIAAIPVVMFVTTLITKLLINVELAAAGSTASKHENFPVQLRIQNRSPFPIGKANAHIEYYNVFNNSINSFDLQMPIQPLNSQSASFQLNSRYCGMLNIYVDKIIEESSKFSETQPGDDPSEVFDLREYVPGDKLNRIHWKLSSKKDEFIVKDYSLPVDVPCTLFLNLVCYEDSDYTLPVFDALLESLLSISRFMLENERVHNIVYYDSLLKKFNEVTVTDHDILSETISRIILSVNDNLFCEKPELYFTEHPLSLSSFTFITSMPNVSVFDIIENEIDADIKNAVVALRPDESLPDVCPDIRFIPVKTGKISSSLTDIEL